MTSTQLELIKDLNGLAEIAKDEGKPYTYEVLTKSAQAMHDLRAKLFPYADNTEISGMSWGGFYLIGDAKSISELRRLENRSAQLEIFQEQFDKRINELRDAVKRLAAELK